MTRAAPALPSDTPQGVWQAEPSELPHRAGLLDCPPQAGRVGLFNVLVQRAGHAEPGEPGAHDDDVDHAHAGTTP